MDWSLVLREALRILGCEAGQVGVFDGHSPVSLEFDDCPALRVSGGEGYILLHCRLGVLREAEGGMLADLLRQASVPLQDDVPVCALRRLDEGDMVLEAVLTARACEAAGLANALSVFFGRCLALHRSWPMPG